MAVRIGLNNKKEKVMNKRIMLVIVCIAAVLVTSAVVSIAQNSGEYDGNNFIPSPTFAPIYPTLPHRFRDAKTIRILCQAPPGAIKKALMPPLEPAGSGDLFTILVGSVGDVNDGGFAAHETAINTSVMYKGRLGTTTIIEYIDTDMGLVAGREVYGWPKKMGETTWLERRDGWSVMINKMRDQGSIPLIKIDYKYTDTPSNAQWPEGGPTLLVRRIPPASRTMKVLNQLVCVGCSRLEDAGIPLIGAEPSSKPAGKPAGKPESKPQSQRLETAGIATVQFFDGPWDPLTMFGPVKVLDARMSISQGGGTGTGGLGVGEVLDQWESDE